MSDAKSGRCHFEYPFRDGSMFNCINLTGPDIKELKRSREGNSTANLEGMTIDGDIVTEMLSKWEN
ncbi:hypothetical protein SAMN04488515_1043 [Cognatiyoonia koreensis]|uniref:Uncharacterized protein n=1 Tax=Cognatiyoonia koreensis TaxID=364200 RepID=A0A1I0P716_9RHOB|nr:hypothetical protein [Cognatiyoonia koreensis]SEW10032.1 hypothetical protein SAMN04488515_1043 [Cognatiyoonia koreensis]